MKKVLHVGCGGLTIDAMTAGFQQGWEEIRLDIDPRVKPDIVGTSTDMNAVADESVDAVYSSHNIEHVDAYQVNKVLKEFRRVLKPDGFVIVTCPDIEAVAKHVAEGRLNDVLYISEAGPITALDIIYGHSGAIAGGQQYMAHRTAFTARTLMGELQHAGFAAILMMRREPQFDLWAIATKSQLPEEEMRTLGPRYFPRQRAPIG